MVSRLRSQQHLILQSQSDTLRNNKGTTASHTLSNNKHTTAEKSFLTVRTNYSTSVACITESDPVHVAPSQSRHISSSAFKTILLQSYILEHGKYLIVVVPVCFSIRQLGIPVSTNRAHSPARAGLCYKTCCSQDRWQKNLMISTAGKIGDCFRGTSADFTSHDEHFPRDIGRCNSRKLEYTWL